MMPVILISTVIADRLGYYLVPLQAVIFTGIPFLPLQGKSRQILIAAPYA